MIDNVVDSQGNAVVDGQSNNVIISVYTEEPAEHVTFSSLFWGN